ncbi:hypothetical protein ACJJTC_004621 [Scirpophaga incertulas]
MSYAAPSWYHLIKARGLKTKLEVQQTISLRMPARAPRYVRNSVLLRDFKCSTLADHFRDLSTRMFQRAEHSRHPFIRSIAPQHGRPPEGRKRALPRDFLQHQDGQE